MKVAVIGSGGREHTLVWKISQSNKLSHLYAIPGNGGIADLAECVDISVDDVSGITSFCKSETVDLVIIGPEVPLAKGLADSLRSAGIPVVGPSAKAAILESSKLWAKQIMVKYGIPTAKYEKVSSKSELMGVLDGYGFPVVLKMDGLQAGKGVFICNSINEVEGAAELIYKDTVKGQAVVVEEFLNGVEASYMVISDGESYIPLASSRDHKKIYEGDKGPNTGGMGAVSPAPIGSEIEDKIKTEVIGPLLNGLNKEGIRYNGIIYAGVMIMPDDEIKVLEFNARFGDPETQVILTRMESDLLDIFYPLGKDNKLPEGYSIKWKEGFSCCVVLSQKGYPSSYDKGEVIDSLNGLNVSEGQFLFHAGTIKKDNKYIVNGGRVLGATGTGPSLSDAKKSAYDLAERAAWKNSYYRKDIGNWE